MAICFDCPFCSYGKNVPDSYKGKKIKCPRCLATVTLGVPQPTALTALPLPDEDESPLDQTAIEVDKSNARVECPFCFELIDAGEMQCPCCGRFLDQESIIAERMGGGMLQDYMKVMKKAERTFYLGILALVCGIGVVLGPLTLWFGLRTRNYNGNLVGEGGRMVKAGIIMGVAGTIGSLILLAGIAVGLIR